jgi:membrane protease YdiL (CAAX protease family)
MGLWLVSSTAAAAFAVINLWVGKGIPWFMLPHVAVAVVTLKFSHRLYEPLPSMMPMNKRAALATSVGSGIIVGVIGLTLTGWHAVLQGTPILPGDRKHAPLLFQCAYSLVAVTAAGPIEEAAVRGGIQLRMQRVLAPMWTETIASAVFVLMHSTRLACTSEMRSSAGPSVR